MKVALATGATRLRQVSRSYSSFLAKECVTIVTLLEVLPSQSTDHLIYDVLCSSSGRNTSLRHFPLQSNTHRP